MVIATLAGSLGIPSKDLWYASRGSGLVLLVLLSLAVVLGVVVRSGWTPPTTLRFVVEGIHRNVALICAGLLVVHVVTGELDPYVTLGWAAAIVPFTSPYRTLWIGLGALSLDILLAVIVTSLFRRHLGIRLWRAVHYITYLAWPMAFVHSLESGTDQHIRWVAVTMWACFAVVAITVMVRLVAQRPGGRWTRRAVDEPGTVPATVPLTQRPRSAAGRRELERTVRRP